jgi:hypothetical protein
MQQFVAKGVDHLRMYSASADVIVGGNAMLPEQ